MAIYAIGDIQGCYEPLCRLLDQLRFDPSTDRLWLVGDLVNRGPQSLEVLRWAYHMRAHITAVLGNHDLSLLAIAAGHRQAHPKDTLQAVLAAPDRDVLLHWLRHCPLLHHDTVLGFTLVHAGLSPQWDLATAQQCATEVENALRSPDYAVFLKQMFGETPRRWRVDLAVEDRLRFTVNALTRMRFCHTDGTLSLSEKGGLGAQPAGLVPWFAVPDRCNADLRIVFGHWAALGHYRAPGVYAIDSGCVWGQRLTAIRLDHSDVLTESVSAS